MRNRSTSVTSSTWVVAAGSGAAVIAPAGTAASAVGGARVSAVGAVDGLPKATGGGAKLAGAGTVVIGIKGTALTQDLVVS